MKLLSQSLPERLLYIVQAIREGVELSQIHQVTHFDPWYLEQFANFVALENQLKIAGAQKGRVRNAALLLHAAQQGFSQKRIAQLFQIEMSQLRQIYRELGLKRVYKCIDTCAAEFASSTPYFYSTWERPFQHVEPAVSKDAQNRKNSLDGKPCEAVPSKKEKIIILGSGPNRIGQGIEFDYVCVQGIFGLQRLGYEVIIVNCNPETVSTDYDVADRLYFEPVELEYVLDVVALETKPRRSQGRNCPIRRPDTAQTGEGASKLRQCRCSAPRPRRLTEPKIGRNLAGCSFVWAYGRPLMKPQKTVRKPAKSPVNWVIRFWCAPVLCSVEPKCAFCTLKESCCYTWERLKLITAPGHCS